MTPAPSHFDPLASAMEVHFMLATELQRREVSLDIVFHGTSGVITLFEPADWAGRGEAICDIFPMRHRSWFVEWRDGKTYDGQGGNHAFVEALMRGIVENIGDHRTLN